MDKKSSNGSNKSSKGSHLNQPVPESRISIEDESGVGSINDEKGWYIPRPALCRNSMTCTGSATTARSIQTVSEWLSPTPSSNSSTQSGSSGSLLLTAANLAALRIEQTSSSHRQTDNLDSASVASSTHFTMVNGMPHCKVKVASLSCCQKHQLSTVVITTCGLFLIGLLIAIYYIDRRARAMQQQLS